MKEIIYQDREYLLTNEEFKIASIQWDKKKNYWNDRLEVSLTPYYRVAQTPRDEIGKTIYIDKTGNKIFRKEGQWFMLLEGRESKVERDSNTLILQEKYYKEKMTEIKTPQQFRLAIPPIDLDNLRHY